MDFIVLVKQVPDVANIPPDAWSKEKGTLRRGVLDNVFNPLDLHALTFAHALKANFEGSRVIALSMGPPQAREVLLHSLATDADEGVLLTDRAFAGADTVATSYSLAQAIRKIAAEIVEGDEYIVMAGMQSVDGDTAQVPPQIAEELGIEHIAYGQGFEFDDEGLVVERIGSHGTEMVRPRGYPLLLTITACTEPLYRSFHRARAARAQRIHQWSAADIDAEPKRIGASGSRTQVSRIFSPEEARAKSCEYPAATGDMVAAIAAAYRDGAAAEEETEREGFRLDGRQAAYSGQVWVYVEAIGDEIAPVSLELLGKAGELAAALGEEVGAVVAGSGVGALAETLIAHGADHVYVAEHELLEQFRPIPYSRAVAEMVERHEPQIMLFGATPLGRELAPRVAYRTKSGLTADCTELAIGDQGEGKRALVGVLKQTRPALGGNIMATIVSRNSKVQMATVRPGVLTAPDRERPGTVHREPLEIDDAEFRTDLVRVEPVEAGSTFADADIIVAFGRGIGGAANVREHVEPLAAALGGFLDGRVEIGASRMAVEDGLIGHDHQVGQTGQTVRPRLYVAVAISGAVQHISGMQQSETVVAINKNPRAPIFNYADVGIVGDFETAVPELIAELAEAGAKVVAR